MRRRFNPALISSLFEHLCVCKSSEESLWFTLVSFFIQRGRNSQGGNGFPGSKAKDVEYWSNMGRVFFFLLLFVGFGTGKEARMFSINSAREGTSQAVNLHPHSSFTAQHLVTAAPKRNKKTAGMRTSRTDLSTRSERSAAATKPWRIPACVSGFRPRREERRRKDCSPARRRSGGPAPGETERERERDACNST